EIRIKERGRSQGRESSLCVSGTAGKCPGNHDSGHAPHVAGLTAPRSYFRAYWAKVSVSPNGPASSVMIASWSERNTFTTFCSPGAYEYLTSREFSCPFNPAWRDRLYATATAQEWSCMSR